MFLIQPRASQPTHVSHPAYSITLQILGQYPVWCVQKKKEKIAILYLFEI